jgi:hypothetical protein
MNGINFQASVTNVTQMDRHQQDIHKAPSVNQEQNALIARHEAAERTMKPVQPDGTKDKKIDADERKRDNDRNKKRHQENQGSKENGGKKSDSGFFLDIEA